MKAPLLIGIAGAAGAGKDAVADFLVQDHGFVRVALADPLKRFAADVWGFTGAQLWGPSERRGEPPPGLAGPTAREALQTLGTEYGRRLDPDVWVRYLLRVVRALQSPTRKVTYRCYKGLARHWRRMLAVAVVAPDVRFVNEAYAIRAAGGRIWQVVRPACGDVVGGLPGHASEVGLPADLVDVVIENTGTLADLRERVREELAR